MTEFIIEKPSTDFHYEKNPSFGTVHAPLMLECEITHENPNPKVVHISETKALQLDPFCSALHYGQSIFEGMKAFKISDDKVGINRPKEHAKRFINSAKIMCMAQMSEEFFLECLYKYVESLKKFMPSEKDHALYLRPLLFANDPVIKVQSGTKYKFLIMGSIVGDYFSAKKKAPTKVFISKDYVRAFPGGTGEAKTAGNYARSLSSLHYANSKGYQQVIYLDAEKREYIEELGGMNFFWIENGKICTTKLNGQILHGITRKSLLEISQHMGMETVERDFTVKELIQGYSDGTISEVFACGTAAVITPLDEIGIEEKDGSLTKLKFEDFPVTMKLREFLVDTQFGRTDFSDKYLHYL